MKKKLIIALFTAAFFTLLFYSCQKQVTLKTLMPHLPDVAYAYQGCNTSYGCGDNTPINNRTSDDGATLGRLLFYDPRLSLNNTVSCATCHKQESGFSDNSAKSVGYEGMVTRRNTPSLVNENAKGTFFWDGRATSLEDMVLMPVQNHLEMGMEKLDVMEKKIAAISYYPDLFEKAFGSKDVTHVRIARALAQFVRAMRSENSKFDRNQLNQLEQEGQIAFAKFQCDRCHRGSNFGGDPLFISYYGTSPAPNTANIGLDVTYEDKGVEEITGVHMSEGAFKIPSLRNIQFSAPYAHDGRYKTLEDMIEHYNSGIQPHFALDHILVDSTSATLSPVKMNMTIREKDALAAFIRALSDPSITTDVRFSNPFN